MSCQNSWVWHDRSSKSLVRRLSGGGALKMDYRKLSNFPAKKEGIWNVCIRIYIYTHIIVIIIYIFIIFIYHSYHSYTFIIYIYLYVVSLFCESLLGRKKHWWLGNPHDVHPWFSPWFWDPPSRNHPPPSWTTILTQPENDFSSKRSISETHRYNEISH